MLSQDIGERMLALAASLTLAMSFVLPPSPSMEGKAELRREALMAALRDGGYTVILRHARTDRAFQEARDYVPTERSQQRNLNDDGIRDAALMGVVFRKHGVTFAEIISSPLYRSVETAEMAAGTPKTTMALRALPATPEQAALIVATPSAGTNRLLVTHHFVIETHVPGIRPGEIGESEAVVVRPSERGGVELVGRITLDDWRLLANPQAAAASVPVSVPTGHGPPSAASPPGSTPAHGPPAAGHGVDLPDTHAGHIAREYLTAFNSGSRDRMRAFIESWMVANPDRPIAQRLDTFTGLYERLGPLTVVRVDSSASTAITLGIRSRHGNFRVTIQSSDQQPMRATSVTFVSQEGAHP
jgi:phosphohistidine phosphatase SixA